MKLREILEDARKDGYDLVLDRGGELTELDDLLGALAADPNYWEDEDPNDYAYDIYDPETGAQYITKVTEDGFLETLAEFCVKKSYEMEEESEDDEDDED